jgi:WD40 repeat protein
VSETNEQSDVTGGDQNLSIGRDAVGNVIVQGHENRVNVTVVVSDQRLVARFASASAADGEAKNPYRGLNAFYESDASIFYGRARLVRRAWVSFQKLQQGDCARILPVVGASGSGKSSLVRAGLVPELAREPMSGMEKPTVLIFRPGSTPLSPLAEVVRRLPGLEDVTDESLQVPPGADDFGFLYRRLAAHATANSRVVFVVDQFEEIFTDCPDAHARGTFLRILAHAASQQDKLVSVIFTLRSDFIGAVETPESFVHAIRENRLSVQAMSRDELFRAICEPAEKLGYPWPPAFVEMLISQAEGRAGALPLLQFALTRLWPDHVADRLQEQNWTTRLIEDFLVEAAESLFDTTGTSDKDRADAQRIIRHAFVCMVQFGEGTPDTRRVARISEMAVAEDDPAYVREVLAPFAAPTVRLITASDQEGEPAYEVTHEALITSWLRFRGWLGQVPDKDEAARIRSDLKIHRRLLTAAVEWKAHRGGLWTQADLTPLPAYLSRNQKSLTANQVEFIAASRRHVKRQQWTMRAGVMALVLLLLAGAALIRMSKSETVQRNASLERSLALEARRLDVKDIDRALLLSVEAMRTHSGTGGVSAVLETLDRAKNLEKILYQSEPVLALAVDSVHQRLAVARKRDIQILDLKDFSVVQSLPVGNIKCLRYDPTGRYLGMCGNIKGEGLLLWDTGTGAEQIRSFKLREGLNESPFQIVFTSDGKYVIGSFRDVGQMWSTQTGDRVGNSVGVAPPNMSGPSIVAISSVANIAAFIEGQALTLVSADSSLKRMATITLDVKPSAIAFTPAGNTIVIGYADGTVGFLPVDIIPGADAGNREIRVRELSKGFERYPGHPSAIESISFRADASVFVTQGADGSMRLWDTANQSQLSHPTKNNCGAGSGIDPVFGRVYASDGAYEQILKGPYADPLLGFNSGHERLNVVPALWLPDMNHVVSASDDTLRIWKYKGIDVICSAHPVDISFPNHILAIGEHKAIRISTLTEKAPATPRKILVHGFVDKLRMDSKATVLIGASDGIIRAWNVSDLHPIGRPVFGSSFSLARDGSRLAVLGADGGIHLYDPRTMSESETTLGLDMSAPTFLELSRDGRKLALSNGVSTLMLMNVDSMSEICRSTRKMNDLQRIFFGNSADIILTTHTDGALRIWSTKSCEVITQMNSSASSIRDAAFSADDRLLVTSSSDDQIRIWNAKESTPIGPPLLQDSPVSRVEFVGNDDTIRLSGAADRDYTLALAESTLTTRACAIANRNLSPEEWRQSFKTPYRKTCPNAPDRTVVKREDEDDAPPDLTVKALTPVEKVMLLANQGLTVEAIRVASEFIARGATGMPVANAIRELSFKSLYDDAQEHFVYERDAESRQTLAEVRQTGAMPSFDPDKTFNNWIARRALVQAKEAADDGNLEAAMAQLEKAKLSDPGVVQYYDAEKQALQIKTLTVKITRSLWDRDLAATHRLLDTVLPHEPADEIARESIIANVIDQARDNISGKFSSGNRTEAMAEIRRLVALFPSLKLKNEVLIASLPDLSARKDIRKYVGLDGHKAFALGSGGWGYASSSPTIEDAKQRALETCKQYGNHDDCRLFAVDDALADGE